MKIDKVIKTLRVKPGRRVKMREFETAWTPTKELKSLTDDQVKDGARAIIEDNRRKLAEAQEVLWASDTHSVLVILQAMDAAGKDGTIEHVMAGVNPQGCRVVSFKQPSAEELDHTFLWRAMKAVPERGQIVLFNRSHYEDTLVVRVHPEYLDAANIPPGQRGKRLWKERFEDINAFEQHLARNQTLILKFFLNVSKQEQKKRFMDRLNDPNKRWKFSPADVAERQLWDRYMEAYQEVLSHTSTEWAPWYVIPADHKWVARAMVSTILTEAIRSLKLKYPEVTEARAKQLEAARKVLVSE